MVKKLIELIYRRRKMTTATGATRGDEVRILWLFTVRLMRHVYPE